MKVPKSTSLAAGWKCSRMLPRAMVQREEADVLYRKAIWQAKRQENVDQLNCSIGPCDVTSKPDLEKLVESLAAKEKHLNLLSPSRHLFICQLSFLTK